MIHVELVVHIYSDDDAAADRVLRALCGAERPDALVRVYERSRETER